jgi:hypothetical protein
MFVYLLLAIMGLGISVSFGCFVQISSMFPPELHAFFFFGNYAPFFIFAPVNVGIGDLCEKVKIDDKVGGARVGLCMESNDMAAFFVRVS